jgi:hypothetical protein
LLDVEEARPPSNPGDQGRFRAQSGSPGSFTALRQRHLHFGLKALRSKNREMCSQGAFPLGGVPVMSAAKKQAETVAAAILRALRIEANAADAEAVAGLVQQALRATATQTASSRAYCRSSGLGARPSVSPAQYVSGGDLLPLRQRPLRADLRQRQHPTAVRLHPAIISRQPLIFGATSFIRTISPRTNAWVAM